MNYRAFSHSHFLFFHVLVFVALVRAEGLHLKSFAKNLEEKEMCNKGLWKTKPATNFMRAKPCEICEMWLHHSYRIHIYTITQRTGNAHETVQCPWMDICMFFLLHYVIERLATFVAEKKKLCLFAYEPIATAIEIKRKCVVYIRIFYGTCTNWQNNFKV